jgi:hypothetical protein
MERASEWNAGRGGEEAKAGALVEEMTTDRSGSAAWRWRNAASISPGEESAGGGGGTVVVVVRGLLAGFLTILRERKYSLTLRSLVPPGGGAAAGDRELAGRPIGVDGGRRWSTKRATER